MKTISQFNPLEILVVEDNPVDYILLKEVISMADIQVAGIELAVSIEEAKEKLRSTTPDIVFMDLFLPGSSGLETFNELKEYASDSAIIVLSGLSDKKIALEAIALGAQDYLEKGGFDQKLLEKAVFYSLERRRNLEKIRLANERYQLATKATHDLIWDWDLETGKIYRDEEAAKQVYGDFDLSCITMISDWFKYVHVNDQAVLLQMIDEIKTTQNRDFIEVEYRFMTSPDTYRDIYTRGYVVRNQEGRPIRLIGAAQDITLRKKLERELDEARLQQQRAITEATIKGQEKEREELGRELHDNINQILATSRLFLDHALSIPEIKKDILVKSREYVILAIQEIRKLSHSLLPPALNEFGLECALNKLADSITATAGFRIGRNWNDFDGSYLDTDQKLTIFRIVQEQLNNVIKHANAKNVLITLSMSDDDSVLQLSVKDDGRGFNPLHRQDGVGLRNIESRAQLFKGKSSIESSPGKGCELKVMFPVLKADPVNELAALYK